MSANVPPQARLVLRPGGLAVAMLARGTTLRQLHAIAGRSVSSSSGPLNALVDPEYSYEPDRLESPSRSSTPDHESPVTPASRESVKVLESLEIEDAFDIIPRELVSSQNRHTRAQPSSVSHQERVQQSGLDEHFDHYTFSNDLGSASTISSVSSSHASDTMEDTSGLTVATIDASRRLIQDDRRRSTRSTASSNTQHAGLRVSRGSRVTKGLVGTPRISLVMSPSKLFKPLPSVRPALLLDDPNYSGIKLGMDFRTLTVHYKRRKHEPDRIYWHRRAVSASEPK